MYLLSLSVSLPALETLPSFVFVFVFVSLVYIHSLQSKKEMTWLTFTHQKGEERTQQVLSKKLLCKPFDFLSTHTIS